MLGTIVNTIAIVVGSLLGSVLKKGIPERISDSVMKGISLCVLLIGISGALKVNNMMVVIISIVIGSVIGELIDIELKLNKLGDYIEKCLKGKGGKISQGFVSASLIFCVGAMAIIGSLESGLTGIHKTLFAKSILDGITAIIFTTTLGIGVIFSAVSVFIYQGIITLAATGLKSLLVANVISDMTAVGSLLIIGLSFNMLGISKIKVANYLPAIFLPIVYQFLIMIF